MKWRNWIACLAGLFLVGTAPAQPAGKVVAVVNGVQIHQAELDAVVKAAEKAEGPVPIHLPEAHRRQRRMQALGLMIEEQIMRQFLEQYTRPVPPEEIERKLNEMVAGLKEQGKSLEEFCQETGRTVVQLKATISEHLRWNVYAKANLTDAQVEAYYRENKDVFDGTSIRVSHIVLRLPANASDADKVKAKTTLETVRQNLAEDPKADFAELAKTYSQDPNGAKGGDLGWIPRRWYDEAFSKAAFALPVGKVSGVVQTEFGVHLIKVTDRKEGQRSEFGKIKEGVRELASEDLRQRIMANIRQQLTKEGKIKISD